MFLQWLDVVIKLHNKCILRVSYTEIQTLNTKQKQTVDDITDRIVELEEELASLQITADTTDKAQAEKKQLLYSIRQKKIEVDNFLPDTIKQFSNSKKNPL